MLENADVSKVGDLGCDKQRMVEIEDEQDLTDCGLGTYGNNDTATFINANEVG